MTPGKTDYEVDVPGYIADAGALLLDRRPVSLDGNNYLGLVPSWAPGWYRSGICDVGRWPNGWD